MGISMSVHKLTDARLAELGEDASRAKDLLRELPSPGECYLADFWDGVHFLLTGSPDAGELPLAALKVGDVRLGGGAEATHAIFSRTARALAAELRDLSEATLRTRFDPPRMVEARVYPIRPWMYPEPAELTFRELMSYFERLRRIAAEAAEEGQGLLFTRYEDW